MKFDKFCSLSVGVCIKVIIVLSSCFQSASQQQTGVYLRLKGRTNFTGGIIPINVIGITTNDAVLPYLSINEHENNGLQCITDRPNCCRVERIGEWYFPDGTRVPILFDGNNRATTFFRNRGDSDGTVNLNRVSGDVMSPIGQFCCVVPDSTNTNQTVCANITAITVTIVSIPPATSLAGENFTLQCSVGGAGDFLTRIEWLNLEQTDGVNTENDGTSVQLHFIPLQVSHSGVYVCQATVQVGDRLFNECDTFNLYVESSQFHLWLMKIDNCTEWMVTDDGQKINDISSTIVDSIENSCQCGFVRDRITNETFQCIGDAPDIVVFAATIHGTASVNSSELFSHIEQWASDGATVRVLHEILNISNMGPTKVECCTEMAETKQVTMSESSLNETQAKSNDHMMFIIIGGGSAAGVVTIIIIIIVMVAVIVTYRRRKRGKIRINKTECVQEEKELNRYENLCASRIQQGVYVEECDYGEIKVQQLQLQEDHKNVTTAHNHSSTNEYEESNHVTPINEPEYSNIMKSHKLDDQSQPTSYQHSLLSQNKYAAEKYDDSISKFYQSAHAEHQNFVSTEVDEEVYDDIQPQAKSLHDPYHPEAMGESDCLTSKSDGQNNYEYTAIPQSSAAGSARYQPLLSRESDYENNLKDYNSINASQQQDDNGSDKEYEYATTKPRYYYRPSVK